MRLTSALTVVLCLSQLSAQSLQVADDPAIIRAKAAVEQVRSLVEAGALPRIRLTQAEQAVEDAKDAAFLRQTLYGKDLTEEQSDQMVAVAQRRLERTERAAAEQQQLVNQGVISRAEMTTSLDEVDRSRKELEWATTRAKLIRELSAMAKAEEAVQNHPLDLLGPVPVGALKITEQFDGSGRFSNSDFERVERAFIGQFAKPMPISAMGETAVHKALGFDHRNRVDVAVNPDAPEGIWLRQYLSAKRIPYFAFRAAVHNKATGAHIHIGPQSTRCGAGVHACEFNSD